MRLAPHPITLRQLQYVVAVADRGNFRRAARDCFVSQPSLSAQVAQVEDLLGVRLFRRAPRAVTVTDAGRDIVERARALLLSADALVDSARTRSDPLAGTLRLGVIPTVAPYLLPDAAPAVRARYPRLSLVWTEERTQTLLDALAADELDGAVLALGNFTADLPSETLGVDPFVFAASPTHPLARGARPLRPDLLADERLMLLDDGHCFRDQALAYCARTGAHEADYRATSLGTLVQMVAGGAGVTLLPTLALTVENRGGALRTRPFAAPAPSRTLALVWRPRSAVEPTLRAVAATLRSATRALLAPRKRPAPARASTVL